MAQPEQDSSTERLQEAASRAWDYDSLSGRVEETGLITIDFGRTFTEIPCGNLPGVHKMLHRPFSKFRVIHRFTALKASRDLRRWTDKLFWLNQVWGRSYCYQSISSWFFWTGIAAGPVLLAASSSEWVLTHICSPTGLDIFRWTAKQREPREWHPETAGTEKAWEQAVQSVTCTSQVCCRQNNLSDLLSQLSKVTTQFCPSTLWITLRNCLARWIFRKVTQPCLETSGDGESLRWVLLNRIGLTV